MNRRIFVVVGAKGGIGATTVAITLAQRFPALGERLVVDADFAGKRSCAVWYDLVHDLDNARVVGSATVATTPDGVLVMELARTYEDGLVQKAASIVRALTRLSDHALIVVDAPQPLAAAVRPLIAMATQIIVLTESTPMGVEAARSVLAAMDRFGIAPSRISLVLSNLAPKPAFSRGEVERALGRPVNAELTSAGDRRSGALFDGFVSLLVALPPRFREPESTGEKPMFDRRTEPGEALA